ncbi:MAG: helix-turn-helix transcriptional regulator [Rhodanobacteraceae bacterium]
MDGGNCGIAETPLRGSRSLRVEFERLSPSGRLIALCEPRDASSEKSMRLIAGFSRGSMLQGSSQLPLILLPLRGGLRIADGECVRVLRPGQLLVAEPNACLQAIGVGQALWIALVAPTTIWRQLLDATTETQIPEPLLLPAVHVADRTIRRTALRLAREARHTGSTPFERVPALFRFATLLGDLQAGFDPHIRRCPGRSLAQRRGVFLRLQRTYNSMEGSNARGLGVAEFARIANYSPCHFVRTFNSVFGTTPHNVLMEQRLQRAHRLVHETRLSITEVARASGFEDRCAFARSFKQRFGVTATATRRSAQDFAAY